MFPKFLIFSGLKSGDAELIYILDFLKMLWSGEFF